MEKYHKTKRQGKAYFPKVNFVRYADDFIVTGESKELLEEGVLPIIREFLRERGLELAEDKTVITHVNDGFDFLGCNVKWYKDTQSDNSRLGKLPKIQCFNQSL